MADIAKVKINIGRMIEADAPKEDIEAYLSGVGVTTEQLKAHKAEPGNQQGTFLDALVGQGILMGWGPRIKAGVRAGVRDMLGGPESEFGPLYDEELGNANEAIEGFRGRNPNTALGLEIGGAIATTPFLPGGTLAKGATLGHRALAGAKAGATYGAVHGASQGDTVQEQVENSLTEGLMGTGLGAVAPAVVRGVQATGRGIRDVFRRGAAPVRAASNTDQEAARRIAFSQAEDEVIANPVFSPAEELAAKNAGQRITNIDRGGQTVRTLADTAVTASPRARNVLGNMIGDRYAKQGDRIVETVRRIVGGNTSVATRDTLKTSARKQNRGAYLTAYREGDKPIWTKTIERLTSSDTFLKAMKDAVGRGKDRAAAEGFGGFNPGVQFDNSGILSFKKGASGVPTYPNLQYWDYVHRELNDAASSAFRAGRKSEGEAIKDLHSALVKELDTTVPDFATARQGAAKAFGAQDALSAGEEFVVSKMANEEAAKALTKMSLPERRLFSEGFADALVRKVEETSDRQNVINSIFLRTTAAKNRIEIALGKKAAAEIEAFLRVEDLMDKARDILGNSKSISRMVAMGILSPQTMVGVGGLGYGAMTNDWATAGLIISGILVKNLAQHGANAAEQKVLTRIAEMLASEDPSVYSRGLALVAKNDRFMNALRKADIPAGVAATNAASRTPLRIELNAGERDEVMGAGGAPRQ